MRPYLPIPDGIKPSLFWRHHSVDAGSNCWTWIGNRANGGYGRYEYQHKYYQAHRIAYTLTNGPIPDGLTLDHLCRNKLCINPNHLEAVTMAVNLDRRPGSWSDGFCLNGHEIAVVGIHCAGSDRPTCAQCGRDRTTRYNRRRMAS